MLSQIRTVVPKIINKTALGATLAIVSLNLLGCSEHIYQSTHQSSDTKISGAGSGKLFQTQEQVAVSEIIHLVGYPTHKGYRQKGTILVGDNYSYLISTGNEALELILQLPTANLAIEQPISIHRYPDNSVNISFSFSYAETQSKNPSLSLQQRSVLKHICSDSSSIDHSYNDCQLQLLGGMYAPLTNIDGQLRLGHSIAAKIYSVNDKRVKTQAEVGVIPLKVILETIELPLEILSIIK
ncbi:hypothetical protein [Psychrobacter piechaudii]|uniref:Uncharacterized protein n=1 Tax=Psychrobacter piechaudii TaxID=1945521 RepID=A0A1R4GUT0_9GAMM|nr:hypothetical protein [Psychrobacter piechaudii]SJM72050.1 hypothetical protein A1232T_01512 [Psychrobacter piechaudii]